MKVNIVTLNGHFNYGNRLQNYALQFTLKKLGCKVSSLWYENYIYMQNERMTYGTKNIIKYLINWKGFRSAQELRLQNNVRDIIRQYNIKKFSDNYINTTYINDIYSDMNIESDYVIVGSDQVWNPYFINNNTQVGFLDFVPKDKRIAYAASFGVSEIPARYNELFKKGLDGIRYISVREQAGADIVKKLTGKDVPVLVDPTLLLEAEDWRALEVKPAYYQEEKYILTYFLGNVPPLLNQLAKEYKYKILNLMDKNNFDLYISKVEEFLYLIDHAELVCTDSFHACVFSILFNTPFLVVNRQEQGAIDMTSRLDTLLRIFDMQDRYVDFKVKELDKNKIFSINFSDVENIRQREAKRSYDFLKQALDLK